MTAPVLQEHATIIYELFSSSLCPSQDTRSAAERQLEEYSKAQGFLPTLMSILMRDDTDPSVRQAGTIFFKNKIQRQWKTPLQAEQESPSAALAQQDVDFIKSHIVELYTHSSQFLRKILLPCFAKMVDEDYQANWPSLVPSIFGLLSQAASSPQALMAGLDLMQKAVCVRNTSSKNTGLLIYDTGFPMILSVAGSVLQSSHGMAEALTEDQCWTLKRIFKIYMTTIDYILAKELQAPSCLQPWVQIFLHIIDLPLPASLLVLASDEADASAYWKMKKWAYHAMNRLFLRYGNTTNEKYRTGSYSEFSKYFTNTFSIPVLNVYLKQVAKLASDKPEGYLPDRLICTICDLLSACIQPKRLWAVLKSHYQGLVAGFIFPRLCYSKEDERIWAEDAHEYVHKRLDPYEDFESTTSACTNLLLELVKRRKKDVLLPILTYINGILSAYADALANRQTPNARSKDGALHVIGSLASTILEADMLADQVEPLILAHVIPDLSSSNHFLRARACWALQHFEDMKYSSVDNVLVVFRAILCCLADPTLPVKIQAAVTLGTFLEFEEIRPMLTEHLASVMSTLLDLTNETDLDSLSYVMEKLVTMFSDEMLPFSVQLATQLKSTLMRLLMDPKLSGNAEPKSRDFDDNGDEEQDFEATADKLTTALGVMKTISTLIITVKSNPELTCKIEEILIEPIVYVLQSHVSDVYDETFDLIESLTFVRKTISTPMWHVFQLLYEVFHRDAIEYFGDMLPSLDNFISYGHAAILSSPPLLAMILNLIQTAMTNTSLGETDRICACQLMESMMLYCRAGIDTAVPVFLDLVLGADFPSYKSKPSLVHHLEVILNALIYDARLVVPYLQAKQALAPTLSLWHKNMKSFTRVHDKKLMIMAIHAILTLPGSLLPPKLQAGVEDLFEILKYALETLPAAVEERQKLEEAVGQDDDSDGDAEDLSGFEDETEEDEEGFETARVDYQGGKFLNHLAKEHSIAEAESDSSASEADLDGFSSDSEAEWAEEELEEELFLETPLDSIDIHALLKTALYNLPTLNPSLFQVYQNKLAEVDKKSIAQCLAAGLPMPPTKTSLQSH